MTKNDQIHKDVDVEELEDLDDEENLDDEEEEEEQEELEDDEEDEEDDEDDDPKDRKTVPVTESDEYKQLQREATKGVKKVLDQNKMLKETFKILPDIAENPETLLSVYEKNPDQAQVILENYY